MNVSGTADDNGEEDTTEINDKLTESLFQNFGALGNNPLLEQNFNTANLDFEMEIAGLAGGESTSTCEKK